MNQPLACPILETARVQLTPLCEADAQGLWELWTAPGFAEVAGIECPQERGVIDANIAYFKTLNQSGFYYKWVIRDKLSAEFLGEFELYPVKPQIRPWMEWGVGFSLKPSHWRQGLMSEVLAVVLLHVFVELGALRVKADVLLHNERSLALLKKSGFLVEGVQAQKTMLRSVVHDMYLLAMTRNRYFNLT